MARVSGSYESVVRGVSEQVPQDRLSGQHWEQVNMVPDPVRGLARRHGSLTVAEAMLPHDFDKLLANTASHRTHTFSIAGNSYDLIYRTGERPELTAAPDTFFCFDRSARQFLPVVIHDTIATQALANGGVSAITQIGRYTLMGGNTYSTTWTATEKYDTVQNLSRFAVWVRGGAYSRTFKVTLTERLTGDKFVVSYKTKSASYPTLLDTSDILTADPDYQKKVNDRVNEYNGKVTAWIGEAAADITPENIATKLKDAYATAGLGTASVVGSTVIIEDDRWGEVAVDDGGDNSLAKGVGNVVDSVDDLCPAHWVGKVVRVQPSKESPEAAFYVEAHPKADNDISGVVEVTWREGASTVSTPDRLFVIATVEEGTVYISDDPSWLEGYIGATDEDVPVYKGNQVGDPLTSPLPNFMGKPIDYLGSFQDRLVVGSGPVLTFSRSGDYFNFFRKTVLSIVESDPVEEYALGAEEDVIKHGIAFNRDMIFFGARGQYAISGRQALTPQTAGIVSTVSKYEGAIDAVPRASGNLAFYAAKRGPEGQKVTSLQQIQPAALSDNPDSQDVSQQLDGYLGGTVVELTTMTKPNTVILRTDDSRTQLRLYTYLDRAGSSERLLGSWHRWEWSPVVGHIIGMAVGDENELLVYVVRKDLLNRAWVAAERFSLSGVKPAYPHLDAMRDEAVPGSLDGRVTEMAKAFPPGADAFEGSTVAELEALEAARDMTGAYLGALFDSYVEPTNPFPRDSAGRAITFGRLTVGPVRVSVADTGGLTIKVNRFGTDSIALDFNGFVVGAASAVPGTQPLVTRTLSAFIGGEVRECRYTIQSKRWLPLTITSIEWAGQMFNQQRRP